MTTRCMKTRDGRIPAWAAWRVRAGGGFPSSLGCQEGYSPKPCEGAQVELPAVPDAPASDGLWLESAFPLCAEAGGTRPGDGLRPVGYLEASKDVRHVVAGCLQADAHAVGHRLIGESLG
jgi:hypothetical protein